MPVNQGVRCQLEADVSLAVVCFGDELKTGARSTLEFLDAAVSLGFRSVELCDRSVRDPATVRQALRDRDLAMPSIALRNDFTGDRASVGDNVDHLISWLTIAASFGCRLARVWTGWRRKPVRPCGCIPRTARCTRPCRTRPRGSVWRRQADSRLPIAISRTASVCAWAASSSRSWI